MHIVGNTTKTKLQNREW